MAYNPTSTYQELSDSEIQERFEIIINQWKDFLYEENLSLKEGKDYFIHKRNLFEIIRRCDKRRVYMKVFHDLDPICEYKAVAVEVFWINTLKPFMVVNEECSIYGCPNEMFCFFKIMAVIRGLYNEVKPNDTFLYPSPKRIADIVYDLKYCSFNREAMVGFIETLADTYGVGISYIFETNT